MQTALDSVDIQAYALTSISTALSDLTDSPLDGLSDLARNLEELSLPDLNIGTDFVSSLTQMKDALPTDLSTVAGPLLENLTAFEDTVVGNIAKVIQDAVEAAVAIYEVTQLELPGIGTSGSSGSTSSSSPDPGSSSDPGSDPGADPEADTDPQADTAPSTLDYIDGVLDILPAESDVKLILGWIRGIGDRISQLPLSLPVISEVNDIVDTLFQWEEKNEAEITTYFQSVLEDLKTLVQSAVKNAIKELEMDLQTLMSRLDIFELAAISQDLSSNLTTIGEAVSSGVLTGIETAADAVIATLDRYDSIRTDFEQDLTALFAKILAKLKSIDADLRNQMEYVISVVGSADLSNGPNLVNMPEGWVENANGLSSLENTLDTYIAWLWDTTNKIDLKAAQEPIKEVADAAKEAVDGFDDGMVAVTLEVQALFGQVESILDQIDIEAISEKVIKAIQDYRAQLSDQLTAMFQPLRDAVKTLITTISGSLGSFQPSLISNDIEAVMTGLKGVLNDETVIQTVEAARAAIEEVSAQIEALSFGPLIDEVIGAIEEATASLDSIDESKLNEFLSMALQAAVAILPQNITVLTDPLVDEFENLVLEVAPVPQIISVLEKPQQLLDEVNQYEPVKLLGDLLAGPFEALVEKMKQFEPSTMLKDPLENAIAALKARISDNANPAQFIEPLEAPFNEFIDDLSKLQPSTLIQPLEDKVSEIINSITDALKFDEALDKIDVVLNRIKWLVDSADRARNTLQRLSSFLNGFADPETQLRNWIDPLLDKINLPGDSNPLEPLLVELSETLEQTKQGNIATQFEELLEPILSQLNAVEPESLMIPVVQAYRTVSMDALDAIFGFDTEKAAVVAMLDRVNPLDPDFGGPYRHLIDLQNALNQAKADIQTELESWDERYHAENSILQQLCDMEVSSEPLRAMILDTLEHHIVKPLSGVFSVLVLFNNTLGSLISQIERLIQVLQAKIEDAILGPDSLSGIRDSVGGLVERLENFNFSFVTDSLDSVFADIKGKLDAINPSLLKTTLETEFNNLLDTLSLDLLFLPPQPNPDSSSTKSDPLDQLYDDLTKDFEQLHPDALIIDDLQTIYETEVMPLLNAFDLSEVIQALTDRLSSLGEELKTELARVNSAYQSMLQAVPKGSGVSDDIGF